MKYLKLTLIFTCIFMLFSSCEKETKSENIQHFIAGQVSSDDYYVDLEPDILLLHELNNYPHISIDLFNDNSWDYQIVANWSASHPGIWEDIYISNSFCEYFEVAIDTSLSELYYYGVFAKAFDKGDTISNIRSNWKNSERVYLNSTFNGNTIGVWTNQKDKYIAIRNIIELDTIHSWIRFSNSEENPKALICHDYEYAKLNEN